MKVAHGSRRARKSLITDAQEGTSADLSSRQIRYTLAMLFRIVCFLAMFWVPSPWRWILFAGAVVLPYIAVVFANQADQRKKTGTVEHGEPTESLPALDQGQVIHLEPSADDLHTTVESDVVDPDRPDPEQERRPHR